MKNNDLELNNSDYIRYCLIILIFCVFIFISCFSSAAVNTGLFVPNPPNGPVETDINIENRYVVDTSETGSNWMFDWGEGNYSDWLVVGTNDTNISEVYSWSSFGTYQLRVKHRSIYNVESSWSNPLFVYVQPSSDNDSDGFINDMENSYGTDPEDRYSYPLDTDGDGKPDHDSKDLIYIGDLDDDNDGVYDEIEEKIASNTKESNDNEFISLKGSSYLMVNTDSDEDFDILFNVISEQITNIKTKDGKSYLDINGDKEYDFVYKSGSIIKYEKPFEIPWLYIIIGIVVIIILTLFILFKKGILFFYQEELVIDD